MYNIFTVRFVGFWTNFNSTSRTCSAVRLPSILSGSFRSPPVCMRCGFLVVSRHIRCHQQPALDRGVPFRQSHSCNLCEPYWFFIFLMIAAYLLDELAGCKRTIWVSFTQYQYQRYESSYLLVGVVPSLTINKIVKLVQTMNLYTVCIHQGVEPYTSHVEDQQRSGEGLTRTYH